MKLKLETIEPKLRERIERQMRQEDALRRNDPRSYPVDSVSINVSEEPKPKRIRQDTKPLMNKLEGQFLTELQREFPGCPIKAQAVRLKIANGVTLTPDFVLFHPNRAPSCWEVKGPFAYEDSLIKLKVAASAYPELAFFLVWKKDGKWNRQKVLS